MVGKDSKGLEEKQIRCLVQTARRRSWIVTEYRRKDQWGLLKRGTMLH